MSLSCLSFFLYQLQLLPLMHVRCCFDCSADATCTELQVGGIDVEAKLEEAFSLLPSGEAERRRQLYSMFWGCRARNRKLSVNGRHLKCKRNDMCIF